MFYLLIATNQVSAAVRKLICFFQQKKSKASLVRRYFALFSLVTVCIIQYFVRKVNSKPP